MPEEKICERCNSSFKCLTEDIKNCQCYAVKISGKEIESIKATYKDCLCAKCLGELAQQTLTEKE